LQRRRNHKKAAAIWKRAASASTTTEKLACPFVMEYGLSFAETARQLHV